MKLFYIKIILVCIVILSFCGCQTSQKLNNPVMVVAHRGKTALEYENTIEAFENAIIHKIEAIELDIHLSSDGILIVHHDPVVLDKEGIAVPIRELKADSIIGGNQDIPMLSDVLSLIKRKANYPLTIFIEIKVDEKQQRYPLIEEKVLSVLDEFSLTDNSRILSFDFDTLTTMHHLDENIHTCALLSHRYLNSIGMGGAKKVVEDMLQFKFSSVGIKDIFLTHSLTKSLQEAHLPVGVWTVNKENQMKKFIYMNVDFIISDNPLVLRQILFPQ